MKFANQLAGFALVFAVSATSFAGQVSCFYSEKSKSGQDVIGAELIAGQLDSELNVKDLHLTSISATGWEERTALKLDDIVVNHKVLKLVVSSKDGQRWVVTAPYQGEYNYIGKIEYFTTPTTSFKYNVNCFASSDD